MDWTKLFTLPQLHRPPVDPGASFTPVVFESREHSLIVLELRAERLQPLKHPGDSYLVDIHERTYYAGGDRRSNGTDKPAELCAYDEFTDDGREELPPGWLDDELDDFRLRRQAAVILPFMPKGQAA